MNLIVKIAWRNIMRHKGKSIVIGVILFLGGLLMTVGNGVISGMESGLQKHIVNGFTGDIILISEKQESESVFISFMGKAVEPIFNFPEIDAHLKKLDYINRYLPIGKNMAMMLNDHNDGAPGYGFIIGTEFEKYQEMFPGSLNAIEGTLLESGEKGILIPTGARKEFFETSGIWFKADNDSLHSENIPDDMKKDMSSLVVRDSIVLLGFSTDNTSSDIRLGVKGIVKYNALHTIFGHFSIVDIESYRQCLGYFSAADIDVDLSENEKKLLELDGSDLDALFDDNSQFEDNPTSSPDKSIDDINEKTVKAAPPVGINAGAYNLVLIRLEDGVNYTKTLKELNSYLSANKLGVRAISWKSAMGTIGSMAVIIKAALFVFVMFLFFVAIIIIVNTLSMAALERVSEIGMMRAVGARKGFIQSMFFGETAILSFLFGGCGILAGVIVVYVIASLGLTSNNDMVQLLFGGDTFHPILSVSGIFLAIIQLAIVTLVAVLYPMKVASDITPLDAISRE